MTGVKHTKNFSKLHPPTLQGYLENKARVTINGQRMRLGNPKHPFNSVCRKEGMWKAFEKMGLIKPNAEKLLEIKEKMSHSFNEIVDGYVYVLTNPAWKDWIKVGMAVDAEDRCNAYQTSSPYRDYKLYYKRFFEDRKTAEKKAHDVVSKIATESNGEWFKINKNDAKGIIKTI
jgi:hypothetical protein|tara:strand:- start:40 stop:561 length:522 start_codon:yes stop_codon:yes gene_type:complete